jgi:protein SCO1/2
MNNQTLYQCHVSGFRPLRKLWRVLLVLPILAVMAFTVFQPIQVLPRISLAPGYSLIDQRGERFTSESVRGSLVLYTFDASRCTTPCISTNTHLASIRSEVESVERGDIPLQFVTIFVDPDDAVPAALQKQVDALGVKSENWHFVTGDEEQLKNVIGAGFSTYYAQEAGGGFTVAPAFVLVDGWGIIRAIYRTATPDVAMIKRDIGLVVQEVLKGTGVNRYAYEAAHLFQCYAK